MKSFASLFTLIFFGIAASWYCLLVVGSDALNAGELDTELTVGGEEVLIAPLDGLALQGRQVYRELGCVACHTQQTRRPGYGGDFGREWGSRQSVARDYVLQDQVHLGGRRQGQDLSNVGARHDADWFMDHLKDPYSHSVASTMPSYPFLFRLKEKSSTASNNALDLQGNDAVEEGFEIVPTDDALALVAYLQSLNFDYDLPESKRVK